MLSLKAWVIAGAGCLLAVSGTYVVGQWHGYDKGVSAERAKLAKAKAENQKVIEKEDQRHAELVTRLDLVRASIPETVTEYISVPGHRRDCLDAAGLRVLQRNRERARAAADAMP